VTPKDLEDYAKYRWFPKGAARHCEGEAVPRPRDDEVGVFKEFFLCWFKVPAPPLIIGALKRFNLRFHQLNPSSFVKMSIYVWGCKSQGVEKDLEGFVHLLWVHPQPRKVTVSERTLLCQFGVCTFVYCHGVEVPV
jgi:hypothetical protein